MARRGSAPGERRGGRKAGVPNKATRDIKAVAQQWGPAAVEKLAELAGLVKGAKAAVSEQARVAAIKEIMDRAYGKATQPLSGDPENPIHAHAVIEWRVIDPA